jgi:hypothetical protein
MNIIFRKTLVYTVVAGALIALYLGTTTLLAHLFEGLTVHQTLFSSAVAAGLMTVSFQPLLKRVGAFFDHKFFQLHIDREEKLYELSREVITHTTPEAMGEALMRVIEDALHPKSGTLFLRSPDRNGFVRASGVGSSTLPARMQEDNALALYFRDHPQPFVQDIPSELGRSHSTRLKEERKDAA